jgi:hypothetical protein
MIGWVREAASGAGLVERRKHASYGALQPAIIAHVAAQCRAARTRHVANERMNGALHLDGA